MAGWARSETGPLRTENQDAYLVDDDHGLYVVADGIGGKREGAKASRMLIGGLRDEAPGLARLVRQANPVEDDHHREQVFDQLVRTIARINREIFERGDGEMGTTCDLLLVSGEVAFIAHVGDSRIQLLRGGNRVQLTDDHTFAEQLKRKRREVGVDEDARGLTQYEHVLTRSIGGKPAVEIDTLFVDLQPGDQFILCSDGVSDVIDGDEVLETARTYAPREMADHLVRRAIEEATTDNVTTVVVEVPRDGDRDFDTRAPVDTIRKVTFLEEVDLFDGLDPQDLLKLMRIVYRRTFRDGEYIIREGEASDELYMILEGGVTLLAEGREIAHLGPGSHFGELALFGPEERTADVRADGEVVLLVLPGEQFDDLIDSVDPEMGNQLLRNLLEHATRRIRDTTTQMLAAESAAEKLGERIDSSVE